VLPVRVRFKAIKPIATQHFLFWIKGTNRRQLKVDKPCDNADEPNKNNGVKLQVFVT
jgi:hypothetical protein